MKIRNPKVNQYSFLDNLIGEGQVCQGSDSVNENLLCVKEGMWVISVQNHSKISKNSGYVGASNLILHTVNCELIHSSTPWTSGERSTPMEICTPRSHL